MTTMQRRLQQASSAVTAGTDQYIVVNAGARGAGDGDGEGHERHEGRRDPTIPAHDNNDDDDDRMDNIHSIDAAQVDKLLSQELMKLSFQDRTKIHEEVHGVSCLAPLDDNPALLQTCLLLMALEVERIAVKPAVDYARHVLQSDYINNNVELRLRFLRSELWDPRKAAQQFVGYFELVRDYYGDEALMRPIRLSDFNKEELDLLKLGEYQLLPFRDRSGRRILTLVGQAGLHTSLRVRIKVLIYVYWVAAEDVESQIRGFVTVYSPNFENGIVLPAKQEVDEVQRVTGFVPTRSVAFHNCTPDEPIYRLLKALAMLAMKPGDRPRTVFQQGTPLEVKYKLLAFGIPVDLLPVTETGKVKTKHWVQWMKVRRAKEEKGDIRPVECPFLNDVIFRFGQAYLSHPGNALYRGLVEEHYIEHMQASKSDIKVDISWEVVEDVESRGGRFLVWDNQNSWWTVLHDRNEVRAKVAIGLKEHRKRAQAQKKRQLPSSTISHTNTTTGTANTYLFERQDGRKRKRDKDGTETQGCACNK